MRIIDFFLFFFFAEERKKTHKAPVGITNKQI